MTELKFSNFELSREKAFKFVRSKLGIVNAEELFQNDKNSLLDQIIFNWHKEIPFQTFTQLAKNDPKETPIAQEAVQDILDGTGGLCGSHAVGAYHILTAIGYDCYPILGEVRRLGLCHAMVIVKDLSNPGDLHLFEVGTGHPTFKAIPLQLSGELIDTTGLITECFLTYKFVREGNVFRRFHLKSSTNSNANNIDVNTQSIQLEDFWDMFYAFELKPMSIDEVRHHLNRNSYLCPESRFNRQLLCCKYKHGKYLGVKGLKDGREHTNDDNKTRLIFNPFEDREAFKRFCADNFPEVSKDIVSRALIYWDSISDDIRL